MAPGQPMQDRGGDPAVRWTTSISPATVRGPVGSQASPTRKLDVGQDGRGRALGRVQGGQQVRLALIERDAHLLTVDLGDEQRRVVGHAVAAGRAERTAAAWRRRDRPLAHAHRGLAAARSRTAASRAGSCRPAGRGRRRGARPAAAPVGSRKASSTSDRTGPADGPGRAAGLAAPSAVARANLARLSSKTLRARVRSPLWVAASCASRAPMAGPSSAKTRVDPMIHDHTPGSAPPAASPSAGRYAR